MKFPLPATEENLPLFDYTEEGVGREAAVHQLLISEIFLMQVQKVFG
jgi:hypothetical protein